MRTGAVDKARQIGERDRIRFRTRRAGMLEVLWKVYVPLARPVYVAYGLLVIHALTRFASDDGVGIPRERADQRQRRVGPADADRRDEIVLRPRHRSHRDRQPGVNQRPEDA